MPREKACLLALDGLACEDARMFSALSPAFAGALDRLGCHELGGALLSGAQAVWAEILTGKPWFESGCAGYSYPLHSLNRLSVFDEKPLLCAASLALPSDGSIVVTVNVPLLRPTKERWWLSDGSLPINKVVSPAHLLDDSIFSEYTPRPFATITDGAVPIAKKIEHCIDIELDRLKCAESLFSRKGWSRFVYRVTLFDQLSHLVGLRYLHCSDLAFYDDLLQFINKLDRFLQTVTEAADVETIIISGFSHVSCRSAVNLNEILRQGGFLEIESPAQARSYQSERVGALQAVNGISLGNPVLTSMEGRINTAVSKAASPVAGCIFINRSSVFDDGCVKDDEFENVAEAVVTYLKRALAVKFGNDFAFQERPRTLTQSRLAVPDFVVHIEGVEFHNMNETGVKGYNVPRTTHSPRGFALLPRGLCPDNKLQLTQIKDLINGKC